MMKTERFHHLHKWFEKHKHHQINVTLHRLQLISKYWECIIQYGKYNSHCMLYMKAVKRANPNRSCDKK